MVRGEDDAKKENNSRGGKAAVEGGEGSKERGDNEELMASYYEYHSERANSRFRDATILSRSAACVHEPGD